MRGSPATAGSPSLSSPRPDNGPRRYCSWSPPPAGRGFAVRPVLVPLLVVELPADEPELVVAAGRFGAADVPAEERVPDRG
jgi:hypothetical protein